jgi:hypothetical protein
MSKKAFISKKPDCFDTDKEQPDFVQRGRRPGRSLFFLKPVCDKDQNPSLITNGTRYLEDNKLFRGSALRTLKLSSRPKANRGLVS